MRLVLDTNVLISGIFFAGPPARILAAWAEGRFDLLATVEILAEYRRVAKRLGRQYPSIEVDPVLDLTFGNPASSSPSPCRRMHATMRTT
jgi:predicted nucleic acid-binding protein